MVKRLWHTWSCSLCPTLSRHSVCRSPSSSPPFPFSDARDHLHKEENIFLGISILYSLIVPNVCVKFRFNCYVCSTWATEMNVLVFIISAASQTPSMIGQGEQVFKSGRVSYGPVQAFDPLLALLERCKVASVEDKMWKWERLETSNSKISCNIFICMWDWERRANFFRCSVIFSL